MGILQAAPESSSCQSSQEFQGSGNRAPPRKKEPLPVGSRFCHAGMGCASCNPVQRVLGAWSLLRADWRLPALLGMQTFVLAWLLSRDDEVFRVWIDGVCVCSFSPDSTRGWANSYIYQRVRILKYACMFVLAASFL